MPITKPDTYGGAYPNLAEPGTFDARMTDYGAWFLDAVAQLGQMVDDVNLALNANETVLAATAEATRRATNAISPATTTGTAAAYEVAASVTIPALTIGEPVAIRAHVTNDVGASLDVNGLGVRSIRKFDQTGTVVALTGGEIGAGEFHVFIYDGLYWVMATQPLREIITGAALVPLAGVAKDFNRLTTGGVYDIAGLWSNGPLGSTLQAVNGTAHVMQRGDDTGARVSQTVSLEAGGDFQVWHRTATGAGPTWRPWRRLDNPLEGYWTTSTISGTAKTLSLPSGVREVALGFDDVKSASSAALMVRLGDTGGIEAFNYGAASFTDNTNTTPDDAFPLRRVFSGGSISGLLILRRLDAAGRRWAEVEGHKTSTLGAAGGGFKVLSTELTQINFSFDDLSGFTGGAIWASWV